MGAAWRCWGGTASRFPAADRRQGSRHANILAGAPGAFGFAVEEPNLDLGRWQVHEFGELGRNAVREHDKSGIIEEEAARVGLDPDLIRAIMYQENARGWYDVLLDPLGAATSILPMNIQPGYWGQLGIDEETARDPRTNIRAGAKLLRAIVDRLPDPTPAKVATIWNSLGRTEVSDFGARVGRTYLAKPWHTGQGGW